MSSQPNTSSPYEFSGSVATNYEKYLGPLFFEPYAIEVSKRIDKNVNIVLELACGTGRVTNHLRKVLPPHVKLIASDLSQDMLAVAKEKLKSENIEWRIIDAQDLPFDNDSMDMAICCFGYMLVPDKVKAFREAYRVLRPGGSFLFATWDRLELNGASAVYRNAVKRFLGDPLPEIYKLPFSLHEKEVIADLLRQAGFHEFKIEKVEQYSTAESARLATEGLTEGGLIYNEIMSRNPAWMPEIKALVEKELALRYGDSPMVAPMSAVITKATK